MRISFVIGILMILAEFQACAQDHSDQSIVTSTIFSAYRNYIDMIKHHVASFQRELISFPVVCREGSEETFVRNGFLVRREHALGSVIIAHGYTHSKHDSFFFRTMFPHFNVIAFDFRAHGELIEGQFSTLGRDEVFDIKGAVDFVRAQPDMAAKPIIGFGFSMGAVALIQAQAKFQNLFDLLILDSPFDSSSDCMSRSIDKLLTIKFFGKSFHLPGKTLLMKALYSERFRPLIKRLFRWASGMNPDMVPTKFVEVIPLNEVDKITIPTMFISCEKDKSVTVDCVKRLYESVHSSFKRLWITQGIKHCGSCLAQPELYGYKVNSFIRKVFEHDWHVPEKIQDDRVISVI